MNFANKEINVNKELIMWDSDKTKVEIPTIVITKKNYAELKKEGVTFSDQLKDYSEGVYRTKIPSEIMNKELLVYVYPKGISEIDNLPQIIEPTQYFINKTLERLNVAYRHERIKKSVYEQQKRLLEWQSECNPAFLESKNP
jgi:hypothetical protein